jgi:hypothetical protein
MIASISDAAVTLLFSSDELGGSLEFRNMDLGALSCDGCGGRVIGAE